jgi:hypothetical protein
VNTKHLVTILHVQQQQQRQQQRQQQTATTSANSKHQTATTSANSQKPKTITPSICDGMVSEAITPNVSRFPTKKDLIDMC